MRDRLSGYDYKLELASNASAVSFDSFDCYAMTKQSFSGKKQRRPRMMRILKINLQAKLGKDKKLPKVNWKQPQFAVALIKKRN